MLATSGLTDMDRRFVTELVYGTTRMRRACDSVIDRFVTSPPDDATRSVLRLGAYQLVFAGVPPHAAVGETVGLAPKRTRGFVNAVLRKVSRLSIAEMSWPSDGARLSYPDWMVDLFRSELGDDDATPALERMNEPPPVTVRADGYVQDESSQWVAAAVEVELASAGARHVRGARRQGDGDGERRRAGGRRRPTARTGPTGAGERDDSSTSTCRSSPPTGRRHRSGPDRSTRCCSTRRARASVRCVVEPMRAGGSSPTTSPSWPNCSRGCWHRRRELVAPGGRLVYSVCTITAAESVDHPTPDGFEVDSDATADRRVAAVRAGVARAAPRCRHRRHGADSVPSNVVTDVARRPSSGQGADRQRRRGPRDPRGPQRTSAGRPSDRQRVRRRRPSGHRRRRRPGGARHSRDVRRISPG